MRENRPEASNSPFAYELGLSKSFTYADTVEQLSKRVAKGSGVMFFGQITGHGLNLALQVFLSRVLGISSYGLYALAYSIIVIANKVSLLGLQNGLVRFGAVYRGEGDLKRLKGTLISVLGIATLASSLVSLSLFAFSDQVSIQIFNKPDLVNPLRIFAIALPFYTLMTMTSFAARAFQRISYDVGIRDIGQPILNAILVGAIFLLGFRLLGALYGFLGSAVLGAIIGLYCLREICPIIVSDLRPLYEIRQLLRFSLPVFFISFFYVLLNQTGQILLGHFGDAKTVGLYAAAARITAMTHFILAAVNAIFAPIIADLHNRRALRELKALFQTTTRWIFLITLPLILILITYSENVMAIFGSEFVPGWTILIVLAVSSLISTGTGSVGMILQMIGKQDMELVNTLVAVMMNVGLNIWFIKIWGAFGAAFATGLSFAIINIAKLVEVYYVLKIQPYNKCYLKPVLAGLIGLGFAWPLKRVLLNSISSMWIAGMVGFILIYFIVLYLLGLEREEKIVIEALRRRLGLSAV